MALDVKGQSTKEGAKVYQWPVNGQANQRWVIEAVDGPWHLIRVRHTGMVLDIAGQSLDPGAKATQWPENGQPNQQWRFEDTTDGYVRIVARHSGLVLDVEAQSVEKGATVHQWPGSGQANQEWLIRPTGGGTPPPEPDQDNPGSGGEPPAPAPSPSPPPTGPDVPGDVICGPDWSDPSQQWATGEGWTYNGDTLNSDGSQRNSYLLAPCDVGGLLAYDVEADLRFSEQRGYGWEGALVARWDVPVRTATEAGSSRSPTRISPPS